MKHTYTVCLFVLLLCGCMLCAQDAHAQTGWRWAISNAPGNNPGLETLQTTIDDSGNVYIAGVTLAGPGAGVVDYMVFGTDTIHDSNFTSQQVVIKADSAGHFRWARASQNALCRSLDMATDHSGNVYVLGFFIDSGSCRFAPYTLLNPTHNCMYYLVKYLPGGTVAWAHTLVSNLGPYSSQGGMGIDAANNIYITGQFNKPSITIGGTTLFNASPGGDTADVFVAKYDSAGTAIWAKSFGGAKADMPNDMTVTSAGNIYISGYYLSPSMAVGATVLTSATYSYRTFFTKMDSSGHIAWAQTLNDKVGINSLTCDAHENVYMTGFMDSTVIIAADTLVSEGMADMYIAKFDSSGIPLWGNSAGGATGDGGFGVAVDNCDHVWISGGTITGDILHFNTTTLAASGAEPCFLAEYNAGGTFLFVVPLPSGGDDYSGVAIDNKGGVYIGADYKTVSMILGPDILAAPSGGNEQPFIAKFRYDSVVCNSVFRDSAFSSIDTIVCTASSTIPVTLTAPTATSYFWYDGATTSTHTESVAGSYWVVATTPATIMVDTFHVSYSHTSPPCTTGIESTAPQPADISLYPNPATSQLTITAATLITNITITNIYGQTVYTHTCQTHQFQADISTLPKGIYFVKVNGSAVRKFVKE